jgi:hypothetical protein
MVRFGEQLVGTSTITEPINSNEPSTSSEALIILQAREFVAAEIAPELLCTDRVCVMERALVAKKLDASIGQTPTRL